MGTSNSLKSNGIGFCGLLTISFIVLKLTNYINWSWWWVLSPLWIPLVIVVILVISILRVIFGSSSSPIVKQEKKKYGFAARLEKMQADQEKMRKDMEQNKKGANYEINRMYSSR